MNLNVDTKRLQAELERLATFSEAPAPAVTRVVFSKEDLAARDYVKALLAAADLEVREDAVGNIFARWMGEDAGGAVGTGSHIDAIPNAGMYDGTVGVLGGLEAIRALQRSGFRPWRSIELLMFTAEEPTRFGIGCLGSRLLSGALTAGQAGKLRDEAGLSLDHVRSEAGFVDRLEDVPLRKGHYFAFVELHIEQGPLLERERIAIGVVESIAAPASLRIVVEGEGGHAGAVLMRDRHDALTGAAEIILAVEALARKTGSTDTVATVGRCEVYPGAVNSVPGRVTLGVDVRDTDHSRRDAMLAGVVDAIGVVKRSRGLSISHDLLNADSPARCSPRVVAAVANACERRGFSHSSLVSRAYHDSLFMSRITDTGLIFIPCRGGVSHRPDEFASLEDIRRGVFVLAETLAHLAGEASSS